jgi:DNA-binding transcriptional MocR family regulator
VISQKVLAEIMGRSLDTVQRAIRDLAAERWIQVVRIGKGKEAAYVINDQVAWAQTRKNMRLSIFSATVVADMEDQEPLTVEEQKLRRIPVLYAGEQQLPQGPGMPPPSQPFFDGMEPDLPAAQNPNPSPFDENQNEDE